MKRTTKKRSKKLPVTTLRLLRRRGAMAELERMSGIDHSYIHRVASGSKPCSQRLWDAIVYWLDRPARRALHEMAGIEMAEAR